MKKILFLLLFSNILFSQEKVNKATYSFQMILDNVSEQRKVVGEELNLFAEDAEVNVYFDANYSFYVLEGKHNDDILLEEQFSTTPFIIKAYFPILYNKKNNSFLYENSLIRDKIILDNNVYNWTFKDESKLINGYLCFKAIGKAKDLWSQDKNTFYTVEAWYCPELPFPFGPNMYQGLPGLVVLAIQNNEILYKLEKIVFDVPEKLSLDILSAKTISVTEYHNFRKEFNGED